MPDRFTDAERSRIMSRVKGRDTQPEMKVRRLLHRLGYRFRLHRKDLPGKPDIVLPKYRTTVFVHGCFWHGHEGCKRAARPTSNTEFWNQKIDGNIARDAKAQAALEALGWRSLTIWQCEIKDIDALTERLTRSLTTEGPFSHRSLPRSIR
jgi:DNA mismatch endonuclease, patch repair protein